MTSGEFSDHDIYRPSARYKQVMGESLDTLLGTGILFKGPFADSEVTYEATPWNTDETVFLATRAIEGDGDGSIQLIRITSNDQAQVEMRVYWYRPDTGDLLVVNSLFTPSEITEVFRDPATMLRIAGGAIEQVQEGAATPSAIDYADFLADIESYTTS